MGRPPFNVIKFRTHVLFTFILSYFLVVVLYVILGYIGLLPWPLNDRLWQLVNSMLIFGFMCVTLLVTGKKAGLNIRRLFGPVPRVPLGYAMLRPLGYAMLLISSMFVFSLSSSLILFYGLSFWAPDFVEARLSDSLLTNVDTAVPQLYRYLMLFVAIIFAPLAEEFIFRGVLLQRWAVRWNLPVGILLSSVLFGILHLNNPLGLTMFGLIMALLYIRTRSLWVPILAHALNNIVSVTPELLDSTPETFDMGEFQSSWWIALIGLCLAAPTLTHFIYRSWPRKESPPPYFRS